MNRVCGKEESSKQRGLRRKVEYLSPLIIGKSPSQNSKHVNHKGRYGSMKDDVQHMEANRMQASCQEVVQPEKGKTEISNAKHSSLPHNMLDATVFRPDATDPFL